MVKELSQNSVPAITSYGLPRAAAPITSTHNIRLRMNPASKLNGAPGDNVNVSSCDKLALIYHTSDSIRL